MVKLKKETNRFRKCYYSYYSDVFFRFEIEITVSKLNFQIEIEVIVSKLNFQIEIQFLGQTIISDATT